MPTDFVELWDLYSLLWEREVGSVIRSSDRAESDRADQLSQRYARTVAAAKANAQE